MAADGSPNVGYTWAVTRADDGQSDPMTGDEWSQAQHITISADEHGTPPVLMLGTPMMGSPMMAEDTPQLEEQSRAVRMCDLLRMKRFDATSEDEEPKREPTNTADPAMFVEEPEPEPEPTKVIVHHGNGHHHGHGHLHGHNHGHGHGSHVIFKDADGNSDGMSNGPNQLSNADMQALLDAMSSRLSQRNPMVGQEWKHRPQPVHVSEENKQAVDALVARFEQMTGRSGSTMDQAVSMQNPMLGSSILGATPPSASDAVSAGAQQMVNIPSLNPVSYIFHLFYQCLIFQHIS